MDNTKSNLIISLFKNWAKEDVISINKLPISGSSREYFRIKSKQKTAIATYNDDKEENIAFIEFSKHFYSNKLNVPKIFPLAPNR